MTTIQDNYVLPHTDTLDRARASICREIKSQPREDATVQAMIQDLLPGLNKSSQSARYYGFVTGGATPISKFADNAVTELDQNVQVHLPKETIATDIEDAALRMLCQLVHLECDEWSHRTFTTGGTASNMTGLAIAREYVVRKAGRVAHADIASSIAKLGLLKATRLANISDIKILTTAPHSSIYKAASVIGLGHESVSDVGFTEPSDRHLFDFDKLSRHLRTPGQASIIVISSSEVNTGLFATRGIKDFQRLRALADEHNAWIHVDAAIGLLARILLPRRGNTTPRQDDYDMIIRGVEGLECADSIAGDAHKLLNVPYDCGIFLSRHLDLAHEVFQNPGAAYLSSQDDDIPSPLHIGIENSRRFRALPVYANLVRYGCSGYEDILKRQVQLARSVAKYIQHHEAYELFPLLSGNASPESQISSVFMIVCFRAKDDDLNEKLAQYIKDMRHIYVSGTSWGGKTAVRIAISNWQADERDDLELIQRVLEDVSRL